MDTDDLHRLGAYLEGRGLRVAARDPELILAVANPLHPQLAEEIRLTDGRYITGFDYEVGERGDEQACADRIAHILAAGDTPRTEPSS
ncbi:hypothetical protein [Streptomyces venezuelae]|uniref:Uncharacterized protein n=1 Tax=Streptomyces venezuelae TaxID=54571 RepID=A0A5P2B5D8_STRVZ|nr:hypothetical protein [Streptomyces venezuelae]QES25782.1 hypothetical protein DEJ47_04335 [Streptomyces venezuelae]